MPIPNTSTLYQKIAKGSEGGGEFARFIKLLLATDYSPKGNVFVAESDASGDYKKVDAYIIGDDPAKEINTSFQFKFFPSKLSNDHKAQIKKSIEQAFKENEFIKDFILITPEDFIKEDQAWFDKLKGQYENKKLVQVEGFGAVRYKTSLIHWGHTKIIELSLKHDHIGRYYFPELFPFGIGKFSLAQASIDCENSNWITYEDSKYSFYQCYPYTRDNLTSDPVFDFHFTNSSPEIFLLNEIEVHIEEISTQIKGIPVDYLLKSIGTIEYEIDFNKKINSIKQHNPIIFEAQKPMRFKLQLTNFTQKCPGNCATIKFWFHFNNYSLSSENFYLSF